MVENRTVDDIKLSIVVFTLEQFPKPIMDYVKFFSFSWRDKCQTLGRKSVGFLLLKKVKNYKYCFKNENVLWWTLKWH